MAYEFISVERDGPVTVVTLNRPDVMNALHSPAHHELHDAFDAFAADPDQWVAIVTGASGPSRPATISSIRPPAAAWACRPQASRASPSGSI